MLGGLALDLVGRQVGGAGEDADTVDVGGVTDPPLLLHVEGAGLESVFERSLQPFGKFRCPFALVTEEGIVRETLAGRRRGGNDKAERENDNSSDRPKHAVTSSPRIAAAPGLECLEAGNTPALGVLEQGYHLMDAAHGVLSVKVRPLLGGDVRRVRAVDRRSLPA